MKNIVRIFALASTAALVSIGSLQASVQRVTKVNIPFEFQVSGAKLPAGEYRIEQDASSEISTMTHVRTGKRIRVMTPATLRSERPGAVQFVPSGDVLKLKIN